MGEVTVTEYGLGAAYREDQLLGYDGISRDRDRVSAVHFLPALDKVHFVRNGRIRVVTRSTALVPENFISGVRAFLRRLYR